MTDVQEYFKTYPKSDECFQTSDGFIFHNSHDASANASSLKDKKVKHFERGAKKAADEAAKKAADEAAKKAADEDAKNDEDDSKPKGGKKAGKTK